MDLKSLIEKEIHKKKRDLESLQYQLERKIKKNAEATLFLQENLNVFEALKNKHPNVQIIDWSTKNPHFINVENDSDYSKCNVHIYVDKYSGGISVHRYEYVKVGDRNIRVYKEQAPVQLIGYDQPSWRIGRVTTASSKVKATINTAIVEKLLESKYKTKVRKTLIDIMTGKYPNCAYNNKATYIGVPDKIKKLVNFA